MKSYINIKRFANDVRPVKKTQLSKKKDLWFIWSPLKGRTEEWGHQKRQHAGLELLWADCHDYTYSRYTRLVQVVNGVQEREGQYRVQVYKYKYNMVNGMQANGKGLRGRLYQPGLVPSLASACSNLPLKPLNFRLIKVFLLHRNYIIVNQMCQMPNCLSCFKHQRISPSKLNTVAAIVHFILFEMNEQTRNWKSGEET